MAGRPDVLMSTGRSDYPNQINNVIGFPYIFRGALDVHAKAINEEMKLAAVHAIAELAKQPVPDVVNDVYKVNNLTFGPAYFIPKPVDPRLITEVSAAVAKAAIETVAENTVDGIIAPLFYGFIGGAPLAMAYKAVNTLDSTVGYKNDKYYYLGFASAKIDDIANYIPARLGVILLPLGSLFTGFNFKDALKIGIRDRKNHKSPNCAFSEGAVAGALGIQLGGTNVYFGKEVYKPTIGDKTREIEIEDIVRTNKIMYSSSIISIIIFTVAYYLVVAL